MSSECSVVECSGLCLVGEQCMCAVTHAGSTAVCFHKAPSRHCCRVQAASVQQVLLRTSCTVFALLHGCVCLLGQHVLLSVRCPRVTWTANAALLTLMCV